MRFTTGRTIMTAVLVGLLGSALLAQHGDDGTGAPHAGSTQPETAQAVLKDGSGETVGRALFEQTPHGILLIVDLQDVAEGIHALHLHETGQCSPPDFESAGGHFAPMGRQHGFRRPAGPHPGDLPNVRVPAGGHLSIELFARGLNLEAAPRRLLDQDGAALVLHAGRDDYRTDPAGHAGDRIACGVVRR